MALQKFAGVKCNTEFVALIKTAYISEILLFGFWLPYQGST